MSISQRLKEYIFSRKITTKDLAIETGLKQPTLHRVVSGDVSPSSKVLIPLSKTGLSIDWLLTGEGSMLRNDYKTDILSDVQMFAEESPKYTAPTNNMKLQHLQEKVKALEKDKETLTAQINQLLKLLNK